MCHLPTAMSAGHGSRLLASNVNPHTDLQESSMKCRTLVLLWIAATHMPSAGTSLVLLLLDSRFRVTLVSAGGGHHFINSFNRPGYVQARLVEPCFTNVAFHNL